MAQPIIHRLHDPNGAKVSRLRAACIKDMGRRIKAAGKECVDEITRFLDSHLAGTTQTNDFNINTENPAIVLNRTKYIYQVDVTEMSQIDLLISRIVNRWVMDGQGLWSPLLYLNNFIESSFYAGMSDSLQSIQNISTAAVVGQDISMEVRALDVEQLLMTPAYRRPMELLSARTFNDMQGLSNDMISDLRFILAKSVADGISAKDVSKQIRNKLWPDKGGYKFRAERIARTEINNAYASAYLETSRDLGKNVFDKGGFDVRVMHLSALTATTRRDHAARHGGIFTQDEQQDWWSEGANRINCMCSVTSVLVDKETGKPLQMRLHQKAIEQGGKWLGK